MKSRSLITKVCEKCGRDQATVERCDEEPTAITRRAIRAFKNVHVRVWLCHTCWLDLTGGDS